MSEPMSDRTRGDVWLDRVIRTFAWTVIVGTFLGMGWFIVTRARVPW